MGTGYARWNPMATFLGMSKFTQTTWRAQNTLDLFWKYVSALVFVGLVVAFWQDLAIFLVDYILAVSLIGLIIFGFMLARADGWKARLMVTVLVLYGVLIAAVTAISGMCPPLNSLASAEVNATRVLIALAVVCLVTAESLVRRDAYAFALSCLAVPLVLSVPTFAITHLMIPGQPSCAPVITPL